MTCFWKSDPQSGTLWICVFLFALTTAVIGTTVLSDVGFNQDKDLQRAYAASLPLIPSLDTLSATLIAERRCDTYRWFEDLNRQKWDESVDVYRGGTLDSGVVSSLHELTCMWAAYRPALSLAPADVARYVRSIGDSLRPDRNAFLTAVQMIPPDHSLRTRTLRRTVYIVAQNQDSLQYWRTNRGNPYRKPPKYASIKTRALRSIDVTGADEQYLWLELEETRGTCAKDDAWEVVEWVGYIYSYDKPRGFRHLGGSVIRVQESENGRLVGAEQWDVSVPEPGVMNVEVREQWGDVLLFPKNRSKVLGSFIIDSTAVADTSEYHFLLEPPYAEPN